MRLTTVFSLALAVLCLPAAASGLRADATPKENAAALQAEIDRTSAAGGGRVTVPAGTWTCATLWLKSGVELHLAEGAVLQASADHDDYNALDAYPENWGCPTTEYWDGRHFIICYRQSNVSITGPGEINGNGDAFFDPEPIRYWPSMTPDACAWWNGIRWAKDKKRLRPGQLVVFVFCRDVSVRNLTIRNSPCWCLFLAGCENVSVSDYTARCGMSDGNTDGIDIDCCRHVRVENIDIDVGDDAVAIRASGQRLGNPDLVCEDVRIRKARLSSTSSVFRIGVGQGTIRNVTVEDVVCGRGGTAVTMAACYGDPKESGVDMEDIVFRRCDFSCSRYGYKVRTGGAKMTFGIRRITFEDCDFGTGGKFVGADPGCPFEPEDVRIHLADRRFSDARWIWPAELGVPTNTVVEFRRTFVSPKAGTAKLALAADTVYSVSFNGRFVHTGRFPDVPPMRFYDELTLEGLVAGTNELTVAVYAQGAGSFQHWEGDPGLLYALDAEGVHVTSGTEDVWRLSSGYRSEGVPLVTRQLGFSFSYDAGTPERPWRRLSAADGRRDSGDFELRPRPVAQVAVKPAVPTHVIGQGMLDGSPVPADEDVAKGMDATGIRSCPVVDFFAEDGRTVRPSFFGDGFFVTVDLGREECGLLSLDVETDAGTVIDIGHAEHIEDGRIHVAIGGRNFAGRYRAREGRQTFVNWVHRMAGRYIQIHVRGAKTRFVLNGLTVRPTVYPVEEASVPFGLTPEEREIWKASVRTLRLCMHEHYEDCPWREQALYGNDSRNQMLAGYFAFAGRNGMPELSLELLSRGLDEKGWIELCMPAKIGLAIPSFTFSWVLALGDHLKYRHDIAFMKSMMPALRKVMNMRADELVDGLLPCPRGKRYWQFYDWEKDLSGSLSKALAGEDAAARDQFEAPLNLFAVLAFESAARCAEAVRETGDATRWRQAADRIRSAVRQKFWNGEKRQIETRLGDSLAPAELSQALALLANAVPEEERDAVVKKLSAPSDWTPTSLSQSLYKYEALLSAGGDAAKAARREIAEIWSGMLREGATSFWEVRTGWKAFGEAGSLCHGWSAIPVYFYGAYLNGKRDRAATIAFFEENVYGRRPDLSSFEKRSQVVDRECRTGMRAIRRDVTLNTLTPWGETNFTAVALIPTDASRGRMPCFVYISFESPDAILTQKQGVKHYRWPVNEILKAGFATVAFDYQDVFPDRMKAVVDWGASPVRPGDSWGAISTWALAASRVMDWVETVGEIDSEKVAVVGHSRLGKTALWTGATDERFAYAVVNDSGCLGARASSFNLNGETIERITRVFPHWFAPNCAARLAGKDKELPFDQHWLIATLAPRLVAVGSAEDDHWACPSGEHAGLDLARPAWGKRQDRCHYHIRPGGHDITPVDWQDYMSFARKCGW